MYDLSVYSLLYGTHLFCYTQKVYKVSASALQLSRMLRFSIQHQRFLTDQEELFLSNIQFNINRDFSTITVLQGASERTRFIR